MRTQGHWPRQILSWPTQITSNKPSPALIPLHLCANRGGYCLVVGTGSTPHTPLANTECFLLSRCGIDRGFARRGEREELNFKRRQNNFFSCRTTAKKWISLRKMNNWIPYQIRRVSKIPVFIFYNGLMQARRGLRCPVGSSSLLLQKDCWSQT